jgi:hypothetical protein
MHLLARAIITGFGLALGAAVFRKVSKQLGFEDPLWVGLSVPPTEPPPSSEKQQPTH